MVNKSLTKISEAIKTAKKKPKKKTSSKRISLLKNNLGQAVTEAVLITVVVVSTALFVAKFFKDQEIFASIISKPWSRIAGMIQNGVWSPADSSMVLHPNSFNRVSSVAGEVNDNE